MRVTFLLTRTWNREPTDKYRNERRRKRLPWPRYMSLTGAQGWAPICERGVLPCTVEGDRGSSWSWLEDLFERWAVEDDRTDGGLSLPVSSCAPVWLAPPFSDRASPLLTLNPLAPDSTSLPVEDSTWEIYVATSRQRAGVGFYNISSEAQVSLAFLFIFFFLINTNFRDFSSLRHTGCLADMTTGVKWLLIGGG